MLPILNYITWNVSPFIYEGEHFAIGWYGTLMTLSSVFLLLTYCLVFRYEGKPSSYALILYIVSMVLTIFGGHLFQGIFYEWYYSPSDPWYFLGIDWDYRNYYFDHPWKFLDIAHGGFASHGVVLGGICTAALLYRMYNTSFSYLLDRIMLGSCSMLFIRIGNLVNGEIYGVPTSLPWGFIFEENQMPCHPTQIYEIIIFLFAYFIGWLMLTRKDAGKHNGLVAGVMFIMIFIPRFLVEFIKNPQGEFEAGWILNMGQWLSIPYIIFGIWLIYKSVAESKFNLSKKR